MSIVPPFPFQKTATKRGKSVTRFTDLSFEPPISELIPAEARDNLTILTGSNNSGKSAYLKQFIDRNQKLYIGVNRFYSFHHLGFYADNDDELSVNYNNLSNTKERDYQNYESAFFNAATAISRLTNTRRELLFSTFSRLFGQAIKVEPDDPENDFSSRFVSVDGVSLSVTSSGTRLFLGLLAALMDERFDLVAIDEPELGLSPILQRHLSRLIMSKESRALLFPHGPNIALATHSHIFLDKQHPSNNWIVTRQDTQISARRCSGFDEVNDIQLRLLGNDLGELFLPHAVVFVEGPTDKDYLERVIRLLVPSLRVVIQECQGRIAEHLTYWAQAIGDLQASPYKERTFAVYDSIGQEGLDRVCNKIGLPDKNKIRWSRNGIEYLYPVRLLSGIFHSEIVSADTLTISQDSVSFGGLTYKKVDLCRRICNDLNVESVLPSELIEKLIARLSRLVSA